MRVVVVGGGLAGAAAALELARQGAEAVRVEGAAGATALSWGTLDVACAVPGSRRLRWRTPLRDAPLSGSDRLAVLIGAYASHPYAVLWRGQGEAGAAAPAELVKRMVAELGEALSPHGLHVEGSLDENRLLCDVHGAVRVADFVFTGPAEGDLSAPSEIAWVSVPGLPADPPSVALRRLAAERAALGLPPVDARTVELRLPESLPTHTAAHLSAALGSPEAFAALRGAAAGAREGAAAGRLWLFPPVLGFERLAENLAALREAVGGPVAETLAAVPDATPGFRLHRALAAALDAAGVERVRCRAVGVGAEGGRAARVMLSAEGDGAREIRADAVVLATGRFLAGGLVDGPRGVVEPLLGLPIFDARGERVDGRPARASLRRRYLDAHPLFSAGVLTDARLRPLSAPGGAPILPNLHAAGDLLGGFDPSRERTGLGVALVTGTLAARHALGGALE